MSVFPRRGIDFLTALRANNDRTWFADHRAEYEEFVREPGDDLLQAVRVMIGRTLGAEIDGKIYRIYRDIRFSRDKTPYSPYLRMSFWIAGHIPATDCCYHLSVEPDRSTVGTGIWTFDSEKLKRFRAAVSSGALDSLLQTIGDIRIPVPELARVPRGLAADDGASEHARRTGLTLWLDHPHTGDDIDAAEWEEPIHALAPAFAWLDRL